MSETYQSSKSLRRILLMGGLGNQLFIISEAIKISAKHRIKVNGYWYLDKRSNEGEKAYFSFDLSYSLVSYLLHRILLKFKIRSFASFSQDYYQKPIDYQTVPEIWKIVENSVSFEAPLKRHDYAGIHLRLKVDKPDWPRLRTWAVSTGCKEFIVLVDSKELYESESHEFEKCLPEGGRVVLQRLDPLQDFVTLIGAHSAFLSDSTFSWWAFTFRRYLFGCGLDDLAPADPTRCPSFDYV